MELFDQPIQNTFGIKALARHYFQYNSVGELKNWLGDGRLITPYLHIGKGSNLLFLADYPGVVLHSAILGIEKIEEQEAEVTLRVGAGVVWDDFVAYCVEHHYYGVENLTDIPGEVGAAAVQNIGAYGVEVKDVIRSVHTVSTDGTERMYDVSECNYGYRQSLFKQNEMKSVFVTYVDFSLSKIKKLSLDYGALSQKLSAETTTIEDVRNVIHAIRSEKLPDPEVLGNAGSFFMNPVVSNEKLEELQSLFSNVPHYGVDQEHVKIPAAWLIDQSGWKGKSLGRAAVHSKQALVLVNRGGATGRDIVALAQAVQNDVKQKFGIDIHPEVNFIG